MLQQNLSCLEITLGIPHIPVIDGRSTCLKMLMLLLVTHAHAAGGSQHPTFFRDRKQPLDPLQPSLMS